MPGQNGTKEDTQSVLRFMLATIEYAVHIMHIQKKVSLLALYPSAAFQSRPLSVAPNVTTALPQS